MKGIQHIEVSNRYAKYKFDLYRNITIIRGDSGTGKTTLYNMIADYTRDKEKSGINLSSTAPCVALTDTDWKNQLGKVKNSIVFIDEDSKYITSTDFAGAVKNSSNYYVIFNREGLHNLPYSVNEIYEIKISGKYHSFKHSYSFADKNEYMQTGKKAKIDFSKIVTEDSKSGFQFFEAVAQEHGFNCESSGSNSAVFSWIKTHPDEKVIVICDGAAFGSEIDRVSKLIDNTNKVRLLLPESFEWIILKSGIVENVETILENPSDFIESSEYFSWEKYFTYLLTERTEKSYLAYTKSNLNKAYLQGREKEAILSVLSKIL